MPRGSAVERAVTLLRDPVCVTRMRAEPLPDDVSVVLRILTGDAEALANAVAAVNKPAAFVREAAEFYVRQVLLHASANSYRLLGSRPDMSRDELRSNLALLLRWLHPDVAGPDKRIMTERVIKAWNELKSPGTRTALDHALAGKKAEGRTPRGKTSARSNMRAPSTPNRLRRSNAPARRRTKASMRRALPRKTGRPRKLAIAIASLTAIAACTAFLPTEMSGGALRYLDSLSRFANAIPGLLQRSQAHGGSAEAGVVPVADPGKPCRNCAPVVEKVGLRQ